MLSDFELEQVIVPLQNWFMQNQRQLRWRENPSAYYVWVSEIMLQQTRVEAVKRYFDRFVDALPDVKALAECPEDSLLKLWEGLGYYNRVKNMKKAAMEIMREYDGRIPGEYEQLLALQGIGSYTAGAIASIAYERPVCAVDGNVLRVLARVSGDDSDIMKQSVKTGVERRLNALIRTFSSREKGQVLKPRIFNQALMELGALVCVPGKAPACEACPWKDFCVAVKENRVGELPVRTKGRKRRIEEKTVLIIREEDSVAIRRRKDKGLLSGMYEIPTLDGSYSAGEVLTFLKEKGFAPIRIQPVRKATHIFSHVEWHMSGYMIQIEELPKNFAGTEFLFVGTKELEAKYAIPSAFAAYRELIMEKLSYTSPALP